jgi:hypothetical protein
MIVSAVVTVILTASAALSGVDYLFDAPPLGRTMFKSNIEFAFSEISVAATILISLSVLWRYSKPKTTTTDPAGGDMKS